LSATAAAPGVTAVLVPTAISPAPQKHPAILESQLLAAISLARTPTNFTGTRDVSEL